MTVEVAVVVEEAGIGGDEDGGETEDADEGADDTAEEEDKAEFEPSRVESLSELPADVDGVVTVDETAEKASEVRGTEVGVGVDGRGWLWRVIDSLD